MKQLLYFTATILIFISCARNEITTKNDLDYKSLKGKIETLIEYRYSLNENQKRQLKIEIVEKYNQSGNQVENSLNVLPSSSPSVTTFKYKYDKNVFPIECLKILSDGKFFTKTIMKYDELGNRVYSQESNNEGRITETILNKFDRRKKVIEEKKLDYNNRESMRTLYKYDNDGYEIENELYFDGRTSGKTLNKIDQFGNPILCTSYDAQGYESGRIKITYKYDKIGNWTKRIRWKNDSVIAIAERQINYYK